VLELIIGISVSVAVMVLEKVFVPKWTLEKVQTLTLVFSIATFVIACMIFSKL